jgi:hypothetical protein
VRLTPARVLEIARRHENLNGIAGGEDVRQDGPQKRTPSTSGQMHVSLGHSRRLRQSPRMSGPPPTSDVKARFVPITDMRADILLLRMSKLRRQMLADTPSVKFY